MPFEVWLAPVETSVVTCSFPPCCSRLCQIRRVVPAKPRPFLAVCSAASLLVANDVQHRLTALASHLSWLINLPSHSATNLAPFRDQHSQQMVPICGIVASSLTSGLVVMPHPPAYPNFSLFPRANSILHLREPVPVSSSLVLEPCQGYGPSPPNFHCGVDHMDGMLGLCCK